MSQTDFSGIVHNLRPLKFEGVKGFHFEMANVVNKQNVVIYLRNTNLGPVDFKIPEWKKGGLWQAIKPINLKFAQNTTIKDFLRRYKYEFVTFESL